jgi:hypothetical protein
VKALLLIFSGIFILLAPVTLVWGGRLMEHHPRFCISCHEMQPAYDGWIASGASTHHPDCIACHSASGFWGAIDSELRGLHFIRVHFFEKRTDRMPFQVKMPEEFCLQCHPAQKVVELHKKFETAGYTCSNCHKHRTGSKFTGEWRP